MPKTQLKTQSKVKTNVMVVLLAAVGFAAAFGIGIWALNKSQKIKPLPKPGPGQTIPAYTVPGYETPGYQPPGYTIPGYQAPGYTVPGYQPPGYITPGYFMPEVNMQDAQIVPQGPEFKSKPVITVTPISNETLRNGDMEIYRIQISAEPQGDIMLKQIAFTVERSEEVRMSKFRLYEGNALISSDEYNITDAKTNRNVQTYELPRGDQRIIVVSFVNERAISGSGKTFSLHATVGLLGRKGTLSVQPYRGNNTIEKGFLTNTAVEPFPVISSKIFNIDTSETWDGRADIPGFFVWSDLSALPHTDVSTRAFNSRDWFNDVEADDLQTTFKFKQRY